MLYCPEFKTISKRKFLLQILKSHFKTTYPNTSHHFNLRMVKQTNNKKTHSQILSTGYKTNPYGSSFPWKLPYLQVQMQTALSNHHHTFLPFFHVVSWFILAILLIMISIFTSIRFIILTYYQEPINIKNTGESNIYKCQVILYFVLCISSSVNKHS